MPLLSNQHHLLYQHEHFHPRLRIPAPVSRGEFYAAGGQQYKLIVTYFAFPRDIHEGTSYESLKNLHDLDSVLSFVCRRLRILTSACLKYSYGSLFERPRTSSKNTQSPPVSSNGSEELASCTFRKNRRMCGVRIRLLASGHGGDLSYLGDLHDL